MNIGERIAELRKDSGYKQKEIAKELNVAISTVSNYETNCHEPDLNNLCRMADLFGVTTDYLLGRTDLNLDVNSLKEQIDSKTTKADVLYMLEHLSREDNFYLLKSIRLLYYQYRKPVPDSEEMAKEMSSQEARAKKIEARRQEVKRAEEKKAEAKNKNKRQES